MRNKIDPPEAMTIGACMRAARKHANFSIVELGKLSGVHHSQISRCENGEFKTISKNVQKLCDFLAVSHPKLLPASSALHTLRDRFDKLLRTTPGSAAAFARLFDVMEDAQGRRRTGKGKRRN